MQETRRQRLESVIQEEVSLLIQRELKDPRVSALTTITRVNVSSEGDHATLWVSILDVSETPEEAEAADQRLDECVVGLISAAPYFRRHLAKILHLRYIPTLAFKADRGLRNSQRVGELLKQISSEKKST